MSTASDNKSLLVMKEQLATGAGLALAQWSVVELQLAFVFVSVMDRGRKPVPTGLIPWDSENPQRRMFHTIFGAVVSFEVRLDMLGAAIEASDAPKDVKRLWPGIAMRLKKLYKTRHEVAHFIFDEIQDADGEIRILLAPFPATVVSSKAKRLNRQEIDHKAVRFQEMGDALGWVWHAIERQRRRLKAPRPPAPALIQRVRQSSNNQNQ